MDRRRVTELPSPGYYPMRYSAIGKYGILGGDDLLEINGT